MLPLLLQASPNLLIKQFQKTENLVVKGVVWAANDEVHVTSIVRYVATNPADLRTPF